MAQVPLKLVSQWGQAMDSTNSVILLKPAIYSVLALPSYKCCNLPSGRVSKDPRSLDSQWNVWTTRTWSSYLPEVLTVTLCYRWGRWVDLTLCLDHAGGQNPKWSKRDPANITSYQSPSHQFFFWGNRGYWFLVSFQSCSLHRRTHTIHRLLLSSYFRSFVGRT